MPNYEPRHVYVVSFDSANTDLYYFCSHDDIVLDGVAEANIFRGTLLAPSTRSQSLNPIRANAGIGNISFGFDDAGQLLSILLNTKLTGSPAQGLRAKRIQHWVGVIGDAWSSDYTLSQTHQFYGTIGWSNNAYQFNAQDIQRSMLEDIFDAKTTTLTASLGLTGITITVNSSAAFSLIQHTGACSDAPNESVLYLKLENEIIRCSAIPTTTSFTIDNVSSTLSAAASANDTELSVTDHSNFETSGYGYVVSGSPEVEYAIKWTGKTDSPHQLTGVTGVTAALDSGATIYNTKGRGALGTRIAEHNVNTDQPADKRTKIEEYIYYEMNAVQFLYYILTGTLYGNSPEFTAPSHHTLSISAANWVATSEFIAIGTDLWDTSDDTAGLIFRFEGLKKTNAKKFIEEQILLITGLYMPILPTGELGLRRMSGVISDSAYSRVLDESNIIGIDNIRYDMDEIHNDFSVDWNYNALNQTYTRNVILSDSDSISKWGNARQLNFKTLGLKGSRHTDSVIANLFNIWRDRYAGPPFRATIQLTYAERDIRIGDICRLNLTNIPEFTDQNNAYSALDLSVEIQRAIINYRTGVVSVDVFGSTMKASPVIIGNPSLDDSFYTSEGSSLAAMLAASPQSITGTDSGGVLTLTGNNTLTGVTDLNSATATADNEQGIFYYDGDIVNSGTLTITDNVEIRFTGTFTNNGTITGEGQGLAGTSTAAGNAGYVGDTQAGGGFNFIYTPEFASTKRAVTSGQSPKVGPFNIVNNNTSISGKPGDLRGTSGGKGGDIVDQGSTTAAGGAGGNGGAGLLLIGRGAVGGGGSSINLSGTAGTKGSSATLTYKTFSNDFQSGTGAGGYPGGLVIILDGNTVTETLSPTFVANLGDSATVGFRAEAETITLLQAIRSEKPIYSRHEGYLSPDVDPQSKVASNLWVHYLTESQTAAADTPSESTLPTAISVTEQSNTQNSVNVVGLEISATAPSDTNYKAANIYIKKQSTQGYMYAGQVKSGQEVVFWVASDGSTYDIKAHSVSITDVESDDYIERTYTVSNGIQTEIGTGSSLISGANVTTNGGLLISGNTLSVYDDSGNVVQKIDLSGTGNFTGTGTLSGSAADENLIPNGFFDFYDSSNAPDGWQLAFWTTSPQPTTNAAVALDSPGNEGNYFYLPSLTAGGYIYNSKTFKLIPGKKYRARIRAKRSDASPTASPERHDFIFYLEYNRYFIEPISVGNVRDGAIVMINHEDNVLTTSWATYDFDITIPTNAYWGSIALGNYSFNNTYDHSVAWVELRPYGLLSDVDIGVFINDTTFGNQGIQLDYNDGAPRLHVGDGANKGLVYDATDVYLKKDTQLKGADAYNNDAVFFHTFFESLDNFTVIASGSGGTGYSGGAMRLVCTTNAADSVTVIRSIASTDTILIRSFDNNRRFKFRLHNPTGTDANCDMELGTGYQNQGFGFKFVSGTWYAYSRANNSPLDETTDLSSVSPTIQDGTLLEAEFTPSTDVKFYVNDVLVATHTTELPSGTANAANMIYMDADNSGTLSAVVRVGAAEWIYNENY